MAESARVYNFPQRGRSAEEQRLFPQSIVQTAYGHRTVTKYSFQFQNYKPVPSLPDLDQFAVEAIREAMTQSQSQKVIAQAITPASVTKGASLIVLIFSLFSLVVYFSTGAIVLNPLFAIIFSGTSIIFYAMGAMSGRVRNKLG